MTHPEDSYRPLPSLMLGLVFGLMFDNRTGIGPGQRSCILADGRRSTPIN
jgi:hypothetical protein